MSSPPAAFGPGILIATRTDIANAPAINVGYANEFSISLQGTTKRLYGQKQYPLVAARGTIAASGKFKAAVLSGIAWNNVMFGSTFVSGGRAWVIDEVQPVPGTPYTVTVTGAATFEGDLGVKYAATGLPLQRVAAGSEVAGKYSVTITGVNKGKYVFAAADTTLSMKITYSTTVGTGQTLPLNNQDIGFTPTFQLDYYTNLNQPASKPWIVRCYAGVGQNLSLAAKLEDFVMPEVDFDLFANNSDQVVDFVFPEVS